MKAQNFILTLGVIPGYKDTGRHRVWRRNQHLISIETVARIWQAYSKEEADQRGGVQVSCVITEALVAYPQEWGCPDGGERVFRFEGTCNPLFQSSEAWKVSVEHIAEDMRKQFKQTTAQVIFFESDLTYLRAQDPSSKG